MSRIVPRRSHSTSRPTSAPSASRSHRLRQMAGITRSFVIIVASAMLATITIAVAAERPPRNTSTASPVAPRSIGSVSTKESGWWRSPRPAPRPASTTGTTNTVNTARYALKSQRALRMSAGSAHSTMPTRNWRGRHTMAAAASSVEKRKFALARSPRLPRRVAARSGAGPSSSTANTPTATKASSLTSDSNAMASITPSWCSVASSRRVPNRMAKSAMSSATHSAVSANHAG